MKNQNDIDVAREAAETQEREAWEKWWWVLAVVPMIVLVKVM